MWWAAAQQALTFHWHKCISFRCCSMRSALLRLPLFTMMPGIKGMYTTQLVQLLTPVTRHLAGRSGRAAMACCAGLLCTASCPAHSSRHSGGSKVHMRARCALMRAGSVH